MRPISKSYTPAAASTTGYASGLTGAGPFVPTHANAADGLAHTTSLTSSANLSGLTITITGTDADGNAQTEAITGPSGNTVTGSKYFATITAVSASATLGANTMDVGYTGVMVSPTIPMSYVANYPAIGIGVFITGTINFTMQYTYHDIYDRAPSLDTWFALTALTTKTGNTDGQILFPVSALRLLVNSITTGATIGFDILQSASAT
jgi:hypothetical protein